jgi:hypothetical protein
MRIGLTALAVLALAAALYLVFRARSKRSRQTRRPPSRRGGRQTESADAPLTSAPGAQPHMEPSPAGSAAASAAFFAGGASGGAGGGESWDASDTGSSAGDGGSSGDGGGGGSD